jgi:hypothetical protein
MRVGVFTVYRASRSTFAVAGKVDGEACLFIHLTAVRMLEEVTGERQPVR